MFFQTTEIILDKINTGLDIFKIPEKVSKSCNVIKFSKHDKLYELILCHNYYIHTDNVCYDNLHIVRGTFFA